MLEEQCKSWMGITSVAVYWPLIFFQANNTENLEGAKKTVNEFHQRIEQMGEPYAVNIATFETYFAFRPTVPSRETVNCQKQLQRPEAVGLL